MRRVSFNDAAWRKLRLRLFPVGILAGGLLTPALAFADPAPSSADYLAQHQSDLLPYFAQNGCAMLKDSLPVLISVTGDVLMATALAGWLLDIPLSWGFSTIFAPAYAKFTRALLYASGRLVLALLLTMILSFAALLGVNAGAGLPALLIVAVLTVPAVALQVFWVGHLYRTGPKLSLLFYVALLMVHALVLTILVPTVFSRQVNTTFTQAINQSVVPSLQMEADKEQREAATAAAKRDGIQHEVQELQNRIDQDQHEAQELQRTIESRKNAPALVFSRLVLLRAQGKLAEAGAGLADFIRQHPGDPHVDAARGQLTAINQSLSAQLALQHQQEAAAAQAAAAARAHLLAEAAAGKATLSEMRRALVGKTMAEVTAFLGTPTATDADKWGYGRQMIFDPQTSESRGLTVVFSDGLVQGVDYYYGTGP